MKAIIFTALIAVCSCANLDRSYLPPSSAREAGGSSDILQPPNLLPIGSYENEHQGVVVDAAVGIRTSDPVQSGLGASRISYGSTNSKVGEAAFRDKHLQGGASFLPQGFLDFNRPERVQAIRDRVSNIVRFENNLTPETYNFLYETDNGISAAEKAVSVDGVKAEGGYSYTGDDGQVYTVTYTADENGFRPSGAHLPTPPPIPAAILKSLEKNAQDEAAGLFDDGSYDAKKYNTAGDYSDSGDNDRYNDRQSNKVANRPEYNAFSSSFINHNNQEPKPNIGTQNNIDQTNQFQTSQILSENTANPSIQTNPNINKPEISQANFITSNMFVESNPLQSFTQQAIPTGQYFSQQTFGQTFSSSVSGIPASQEIGIPLSQQPLQNEDNGQGLVSSGKPYEIPSTIQSTTIPQINLGGDSLTTMLTQTSSSGSNDRGNLMESFKETKPSDSQASIVPTNQPSRELTTPFEASVSNDRKPINTFSSPIFESTPENVVQDTKPQSNGQPSQLTNMFEDKLFNYNKPLPLHEQTISTQQPNTSYEGEIYQYNKPILSQESPNIHQGFEQKPISFIESTPTNQIGNNEQVSISEPIHNIPTLSSITDIRQQQENFEKISTSQPVMYQQNAQNEQSTISTSSGEIYQYNKPTSTIPNSSAQNPSENNFMQPSLNNAVPQMQSYNNAVQPHSLVGSFISSNSKQPVFQSPHTSLSPQEPIFGNSFAGIIEQNYSSQTSNSLMEQATPPTDRLNSKPSQSAFLQPQPTIPTFGQITIYQLKPQITDGSYNYDIPIKPFHQQNPTIFNAEHIKPTSQLIVPSTTGQLPSLSQNNGITQASISSFAPITATQYKPSDSPLASRPTSFAQATASTGPSPTLPSMKPQEPIHIQQIKPSNTNEGEIYQYNKPEESFHATPVLSHSQIIETPPLNGQLNPQFILSLDNEGSVVDKIEFKPVSTPQVLTSLPSSPEGPTSEELNPDQSKQNFVDSRPIGSTIIGSPCCRGHAQQHKQIGKPESNRNELNAQSLMPQETSSTIKGEQFDVNRKPSTFDSTGYHY